ncbi:MAG: PaaI family thioesterase [Deltaproteobacteria bacterium]|nr:PaaI family thioesterase [Deltaproteobacteria bacterium]
MPDYTSYLQRLRAGEKGLNPFLDFFKITLEDLQDGYARFRMPVRPEYMQGAGFMQGGVIVAMADEAIAHAIMTVLEPGTGITTIELKSNFLAPVRDGELTADARVFKKGRTLIIGDCLVKNDNGRDVLRCAATFLSFSGTKDSE